eukprot:CAMPEP_0206299232 /NCGR_PEP_ID=MMETSP0106_2-20121207/7085_1 /ASSEMBLY_ACC=CAM_ASM_000206 /TAXON_ID=81532 /ORGANISM="Acanthoeca-like sp., Strain 10tr" /LENGTH=70 /DNA_ID=CAMNT_0053729929 /DNA_START=548 /DNA_END=756 /DNA_ORIENTATION=-
MSPIAAATAAVAKANCRGRGIATCEPLHAKHSPRRHLPNSAEIESQVGRGRLVRTQRSQRVVPWGRCHIA